MPPQAGRPTPRRVDVILQRFAWIAQILLVVAAIAGYLLTVRPVYQKQLLDEQIAERTVQLREANSSLANLKAVSEKLKADNLRLLAEANTSYDRLRRNLMSELSSVASTCTYGTGTDVLNGQKLADCVTRWVNINVAAYLRPADKEKVLGALAKERDAITKLPQKLTASRAAKLRKARREYAEYDAEAKRLEREIITGINSIREKSGGQTEPLKNLKDLKQLRSYAEQSVYDKFISQYVEMSNKRSDANFDKIVAEDDVTSNLSDALRAIMRKIADSLGR